MAHRQINRAHSQRHTRFECGKKPEKWLRSITWLELFPRGSFSRFEREKLKRQAQFTSGLTGNVSPFIKLKQAVLLSLFLSSFCFFDPFFSSPFTGPLYANRGLMQIYTVDLKGYLNMDHIHSLMPFRFEWDEWSYKRAHIKDVP